MNFFYSIFLSLIVLSAFPQDNKTSKFFIGRGMTTMSDIVRSPANLKNSYNVLYDGTIEVNTTNYFTFSYSLFTFYMDLRMNLFEFSDETAISLKTQPAIVASMVYNEGGNSGNGNIILPLFIGGEFGAGSTYKSLKNLGFYIGTGIEYIYQPLINYESNETSYYIRGWIQPAVMFGFRTWNKANKLNEINFKIGRGSKADVTKYNLMESMNHLRPYSFRVSFIRFINY